MKIRVILAGLLLCVVPVAVADDGEAVGCVDVEYPPQSSSPYLLPYAVGDSHNVRQGNCNSENTHNAEFNNTFAYDFEMPIGTLITAARGGEVIFTRDGHSDFDREITQANLLIIAHDDGTYARYGHLTRQGILVEKGQRVEAGQAVARSGNSGLSRGPHLHFDVSQCPAGKPMFDPACATIPVTFRNTRPHPHGLQGSPTSEIGGGEWYEALSPDAVPVSVDADGPAGYWTIQEIAPGVYAALQPSDVRFNDSNVIIIVNEDEIVLVDAPSHPGHLRELISEIEKISTKPVRFVINTHWHADHTQGNALYKKRWGGALVLGHETLVEDVPLRAEADLVERVEGLEKRIPAAEKQLASGLKSDGSAFTEEELKAQRAAIDRARGWVERNRGAVFLVPEVTYREKLVLDRGSRTIELHHFNAHTRGDTVVYLPEEKILLTGDMLDDLPYAGHGYPSSWVHALEMLERFDFEKIVPGHGPVYLGRDQLEMEKGFFEDLLAQVRAAVAEEKTLDEVKELVDLGKWRDPMGKDDAGKRFFDQTLGEAIERTFLQLRGELPN